MTDWRELPSDEFRERVAEAAAGDAWGIAEMTARYEAVLRDPAFAHLELVRLRTHAEIADYLT